MKHLTELDQIREYRILNKIGEGGMGKVFLGEDTNLQRKVAIKILAPQLTLEPQFIDRFKQEARLQANLIHSNIITLHAFFEEDANYYMIMEFAEGITLKEMLKISGPLTESRSLKMFLQLLDALGYAHSRGIVHRDIKPGNIIVDNNDNVKIMDFGIAKEMGERGLTQTGTKLGTISYMSPEQIRAEREIDQRTDIYSLGITFFEMLTGKLPFNSNNESEFMLMEEIVRGVIPEIKKFRLGINEKLIAPIYKMTSKQKEDRPATCYQVTELLREIKIKEASGNTLISGTVYSTTTSSEEKTSNCINQKDSEYIDYYFECPKCKSNLEITDDICPLCDFKITVNIRNKLGKEIPLLKRESPSYQEVKCIHCGRSEKYSLNEYLFDKNCKFCRKPLAITWNKK